MGLARNIRRLGLVILWSICATGVVFLLVAAINMRNKTVCSGFAVNITGAANHRFLDQRDVLNMLTQNGVQKITGKTILSYDLRGMEEILKRNPCVKDAQLFFDNNTILQIRVLEREPIARIFTTGGNSFYIDSSGAQMPVLGKAGLKLPVFTGYPAEKIRLRGVDSALADQVRKLAWYILRNDFWMAEIEQINIESDRTFSMVPVIGNHIIMFGDGTDYQAKLHRLFVFYQDIMAKTGFDKYETVDVRFTGQVIGKRRGGGLGRQDSVLAIKNIRQMILAAEHMPIDTVRQQNIRPLEHNTVTEQTLTNYDLVPSDEDSTGPKPGVNKDKKKQ